MRGSIELAHRAAAVGITSDGVFLADALGSITVQIEGLAGVLGVVDADSSVSGRDLIGIAKILDTLALQGRTILAASER